MNQLVVGKDFSPLLLMFYVFLFVFLRGECVNYLARLISLCCPLTVFACLFVFLPCPAIFLSPGQHAALQAGGGPGDGGQGHHDEGPGPQGQSAEAAQQEQRRQEVVQAEAQGASVRRRSQRLRNLVLRFAPHTIKVAASLSLSLLVGLRATERPGGGRGLRWDAVRRPTRQRLSPHIQRTT